MAYTYGKFRIGLNTYPGAHEIDLSESGSFGEEFVYNASHVEMITQRKKDVYKDTHQYNFASEGLLSPKSIVMQGFTHGDTRLTDLNVPISKYCIGLRGEKILLLCEAISGQDLKRFMYVWGGEVKEVWDGERNNIIDYQIMFDSYDGKKHGWSASNDYTTSADSSVSLATLGGSAYCVPYLYKIEVGGTPLTSLKIRDCSDEADVDNISRYFQIEWSGSVSSNTLWIAEKVPHPLMGNGYIRNAWATGASCPAYYSDDWNYYTGITMGLDNPRAEPDVGASPIYFEANTSVTFTAYYRIAYI